ncbi:MAG: chloramphenicol acetyltransferase [Saprospirales bacterium]|nr:chloramphenicol acetyltransferase [Saprospirales bacterium]
MPEKLDLSSWPRTDHFHFFRQFDDPFFGVCVEVDCTEIYRRSKESGISFFLLYLHKALVAINRTEPFRYRIEGEEVIVHDTVGASPTISRPDGTFGFSYIPYAEDFPEFERQAKVEMERVRFSKGLIPANSSENVVHFSSLPWLKFTSLSHARNYGGGDSIPKISFGKVTEQNGRQVMPVSIHVHHALMDGYHVGKFVELFQELLDEIKS